MTTLIAKALNLQIALGLGEDKLPLIQQAMKDYAVDMLNVAKHPIEKRETPETMRKFVESHGISYDGKSKLFK